MKMKRDEKKEKEEVKEHLPLAKAVSQMIVKHSTPTDRGTVRWADIAKPKGKSNNKNNKKNTPNQSALAATGTSTKPEKKKNNINNNLMKNILVCAMHAHIHNRTYPGTYNTKLNQLLQKNNIPYTDVGDDWNSKEILAAMNEDCEEMETEEETEKETVEEEGDKQRKKRQRKETEKETPETLREEEDEPLEVEIPLWIKNALHERSDKTIQNELLQMEKVIGEEQTIGQEEKQEKKKKKKKTKKKNKQREQQNPVEKGTQEAEKTEKEENQRTTEEARTQEADETEEDESQRTTEDEREEARAKWEKDIIEAITYRTSEDEYEGETDEELYTLNYLFNSKSPLTEQDKVTLRSLYKDSAEWGEELPRRLQSGVAYWLAGEAEMVHRSQPEVDVYVRLNTNLGMTEKEIEEKEEEYIQKSREFHGNMPSTQEDASRLLYLVTKHKRLQAYEIQEMIKLYREVAQTKLINLPSLKHKIIIAAYRTLGVCYKIRTLLKMNRAAQYLPATLLEELGEEAKSKDTWDF